MGAETKEEKGETAGNQGKRGDKAQGNAGNHNKHLIPTMGRIVRVNEMVPGAEEGEDSKMVQHPALITAADPATNRISVTVFRESWVDHIQNLPMGTGHKTWSWPPRD